MPPAQIKVGKIAFAVWTLGDGRVAFDYRDGSRRRIVVRKRFEDLKKAASDIALKLINGETESLQLSPQECRIFVAAREVIAPLDLDLDRAARLIVEAALLAGGLDQIMPALRRGRERVVTQAGACEVAVAHFLSTIAADGVSTAYEKKCRADLKRFAEKFPCPLVECRATEIDAWLRDLRTAREGELSRRRRRNLRDLLVTFFRFARRHGYLPDGLITEAEKISRPKVARKRPPIFTPAEFTLLIEQCHQPPDARRGRLDYRKFLAPLVIGAFAGLRWSEIARLDWREVHFDDATIEVSDEGKTGRRLVPIVPNLAAWLAPFRDSRGPVLTFQRHDHAMSRLIQRAGLPAIARRYSNALRHSFITYRVAVTKNEPQVAHEAGNSVAEIKRSYLNPQLRPVAEKWFALAPDAGDKVVQMPLGMFGSR